MLCASLVYVLQGSQASTITVWEPSITVEKLCERLSAAGLPCNSTNDAAGRYVTIFASNCAPFEIAVNTASAMGFELKRRASAWLMTTSPAYERAKNRHDLEVKRETNLAFDQLLRRLKAVPPPLPSAIDSYRNMPGPAPKWTLKIPLTTRKREFRQYSVELAHWKGAVASSLLLANATEDQVRHLKNGHIVAGTCPPLPGTVPLPGKPSDYQHGRKDSQVYVFARWLAEQGSVLTSVWSFNSGGSGGVLNIHNNDSWNEIGMGWSTLWDEVMAWAGSDYKRFRFEEDGSKKRSYASTLELIARQTGKHVVSEASPRFDYPQPKEFYSALKEFGSWMMFRPSHFQEMDSLWKLRTKLEAIPEPDVDNVVNSIDWAAKYCLLIKGRERFFYHESFAERIRMLVDNRCFFSKFWLSLNSKEKRGVLSRGIRVRSLSGSKQVALQDALLESIPSSGRTSRVEAFFDPSFVRGLLLKIETRKGWGFESESSAAFGTRPQSKPPVAIPPPKQWWPVEGFWCYLKFSLDGCPEAEIFRDFKVTRRGAPLRP